MTETLKTLIQQIAALDGREAASLDPDVPIQNLDLKAMQITQAINALEQNVASKPAAADSTQRGLANLAAFSDRAQTALRHYIPPQGTQTLRSIALDVDAKRTVCVQTTPDATPRGRVLARFGGLFGLAVAAPALWAMRPLDPVCAPCALTPAEQFTSVATFSIPAALIITLAVFAPALWHLYRLGSAQRTAPARA